MGDRRKNTFPIHFSCTINGCQGSSSTRIFHVILRVYTRSTVVDELLQVLKRSQRIYKLSGYYIRRALAPATLLTKILWGLARLRLSCERSEEEMSPIGPNKRRWKTESVSWIHTVRYVESCGKATLLSEVQIAGTFGTATYSTAPGHSSYLDRFKRMARTIGLKVGCCG